MRYDLIEKNKSINKVLSALGDMLSTILSIDNAGRLWKDGRKTLLQFKEYCIHQNLSKDHGGCLDCGAYGCQVI